MARNKTIIQRIFLVADSDPMPYDSRQELLSIARELSILSKSIDQKGPGLTIKDAEFIIKTIGKL
jgi:hypothetical protein